MRGRDFILRRMVALRVPSLTDDDPAMDWQWFEHLRASATAAEPPSATEPMTGVRGPCRW